MTTQPTDPSPLLFEEYFPEELFIVNVEDGVDYLAWKFIAREVFETEYLDLCHRIEKRMTEGQTSCYDFKLWAIKGNIWHATWQQRLAAIHETLKGK